MSSGLLTASYSWSDITSGSEQLLTPDFPDTVVRGTGDIASGSGQITDIKDLAGNPIPMPKRDIHQADIVDVGYYSYRLSQTISAVGANSVTSTPAYAFSYSDAPLWLRDRVTNALARYMVLGYELNSAVKAKYTFQDEDGAEVGAPVWLGIDGHKESSIWFPCTVAKRLRLVASAAGAGSITINYRVQTSAPGSSPA